MTNGKKLTDSDLLQELREGDKNMALKRIYHSLRNEFEVFAKRYTNDQDLIVDIFQSSMIAFYENTCLTKTFKGQSSIKTYVFSIGKNKLINRLKKSDQEQRIDEFVAADMTFENDLEKQESSQEMYSLFNQLGENCRRLLLLFYYDNNSIDAIRNKMGFKSDSVVKVTKVRCMKQLRSILLKRQGS